MKQSKRMLSVLLAIIMICSTFTIGAQALKANIENPIGYDEVLDPVISSEQAARMILDEIDPLLAEVDVDEDVAGLEIKIKSIDTLLDTVHNLGDSSLVGFAKLIANLGDIEDLALDAGDVKDSKGNRCRRANATSTDFEVLGAVLTFLETNASYIAKFAYNGFDFGWLDGLGVFGNDDLAALNDVHGLVVTLVDKLLAGEDFELDIETEYNTNKTLDGILQDFIDNKLVKIIVDLLAEDDGTNMAADILGLNGYLAADGTLTQDIPTTTVFPSLTDGEGKLGRLSLNQDSFYDFVIKIVKAAVDDVVIPYAGALLGDLIDDDISGVIDAVVQLLEFDVDLTACETAKDKIDTLLNYLLRDGGIKNLLLFKEGTSPTGVAVKYLSFADGFWTKLTDILRTVLPMLPALLGDDCPNFDKTDAELSELNMQQFLTYVLQRVLEKFVDGVQFAEDCNTIRELASRTLIEVCKDLMPEKNFEEEFEAGQKTYDSDDCLTLGAYVIRYYLNGETTIQDNTPDSAMNLTAMLNTAADWALNKFGSVFGYDASKYTNSSVWQKVYDTAFALIPLNLFVGAAPVSVGNKQIFLPGVPDSATGLQNLILDDILGGVLEFNIQEGELNEVGVTGIGKVLSLIGRRADSELNKPIPQFLMDLVARLINPLFGLPTERTVNANPSYNQLNLIIPYSYTSLDQLITANHNTSTLSLTNTLYQLCRNIGFINKGTGSLFYSGCPFIAQIMGLWGTDDEKYVYPFVQKTAPTTFNGGKQYSYDALKALYEEYADESNEGISYDDDAYSYFHMVDFQPFLYLDFKDVRSDVADLLNDYETGKIGVADFRIQATDLAYQFTTVIRFMEQGFNWDKSEESNENNYDVKGETTANDNQLIKVINKANAANYAQEEFADGSKTYSDRTWNAYEKAKAFADKVEAEYQAAKASNDSVKALRDMRQSRINEARKQLVEAMAALKAWIPLADYSMLDDQIMSVEGIPSFRQYEKKSVQRVVNAYLEAINLARDYDAEEQFVVDNAYDTLADAFDRLAMVDFLYLDDYARCSIDESKNYIFGFDQGFATQQAMDECFAYDFNEYVSYNYFYGLTPDWDICPLDVDSTPNGNGTGAIVKMCMYNDEGELVVNPQDNKYTIILFGDVDGDAFANACDSTILRAYSLLKLTDAQLGAPAVFAGDANESGTVDSKDAKVCESSGIMKAFPNQLPEAIAYQDYNIRTLLNLD